MPGPLAPPSGARFSTGEDLGFLIGPSTPPVGAVIVSPDGIGLDFITSRNPPGTTFYLLPGVHTIGAPHPSVFSQVVPLDGNTYVGAPGAIIDGHGINLYAFTQHAVNVTIEYLEIRGFICPFDEFTVNHDAGDNWTIRYCNIHNNGGAGVGLGTGALISHCWLHDNTQYGYSSFAPPVDSGATSALSNVTIDHCEIAHNGDYNDEFNPDGTPTGHGRNGAGKFWDTNGITFTNSWVHENLLVGVWADTNNINFHFEGNLVENNWAVGLFYEISYNFLITNNTFRGNAITDGLRRAAGPDNFPTASIYISESGGDVAVSATNAASAITGNTFVNNWGDITLWENSDRFCNSPSNTSGKVYKPHGHGASLAECNNPVAKVLTVSLTAGSPLFTVTSGVLENTDEGRPASGVGIPDGATLDEPTNANGFSGGYLGPTQGRLSANATTTAIGVTLTLAAGSINVDPAFTACRWHTQNITIEQNAFYHNRAAVLGPARIPSSITTGKMAMVALYGTFPSWSPYQGTTIQQSITFTQNNLWRNNTYTGDYGHWVPSDTSFTKSFSEWQAAPYAQDGGSTLSSLAYAGDIMKWSPVSNSVRQSPTSLANLNGALLTALGWKSG